MLDVVLAVGAIALTIEKIVSFLRNAFGKDAQGADKYPTWVYNVLALAIGVGAVIGWPDLNLAPAVVAQIPRFAATHALDGTSGQVLTGLIAGAATGFWYAAFQALEASVHRNRGTS
jgi:hypothetical protein